MPWPTISCIVATSYHSVIGRKQLSASRREAEECAAHILMPGLELAKVIDLPVWDLADHFDVPEELVFQRINEFATQEEIERWDEACEDNVPD